MSSLRRQAHAMAVALLMHERRERPPEADASSMGAENSTDTVRRSRQRRSAGRKRCDERSSEDATSRLSIGIIGLIPLLGLNLAAVIGDRSVALMLAGMLAVIALSLLPRGGSHPHE
jgi:hypothetical protein